MPKVPLEPKSGRLPVISLFSGAGGLDLGLERSGWEILAQVEMDADAVETLKRQAKNRVVPTLVLDERIEDVPPADLRRQLSLRRGELALLAGGPPCQPFTTSGLRKALTDPRASSLFPAYLSFVEEFLPRALAIENVDGLLSAALSHRPLVSRGRGHAPMRPDERKGSFLKWFVEHLIDLGYTVTWGVVEAADYGVPQMRQRALLLAVRDSDPCFLPPPTFGPFGKRPYRTLRDALKGVRTLGPIQPLSARKRAVYAEVPPGGNWRDLPDSLRQATMGAAYWADGGRSGWWRRLDWDMPAPTILGMPDHSSTALIHPDEVRCLSVNECAAVQTFPLRTEFGGSARSQYQQIGNAVPPLMAEAVGRQLRKFLGGTRQSFPKSPEWRKASANRRVGTHGIAWPGKRPNFELLVKVRPDHIWAGM